jgi:release factor glutamine methyltransferase
MTDNGRPRLAEQRDLDEVYGPAEDSHLLAETAVERVDSAERVLDVGTGSGYVASSIREGTGAWVVGSDLNPKACRRASGTGIPVVCGDLLSPFRADSFDVVCFNPPYLPTPREEEWGDWMNAALSGGPEGRAVIDRFLDDVGRVLDENGRVYLLISTLTGPDEVRDRAAESGFVTGTVAEESHPFEKLLVLELTRE